MLRTLSKPICGLNFTQWYCHSVKYNVPSRSLWIRLSTFKSMSAIFLLVQGLEIVPSTIYRYDTDNWRLYRYYKSRTGSHISRSTYVNEVCYNFIILFIAEDLVTKHLNTRNFYHELRSRVSLNILELASECRASLHIFRLFHSQDAQSVTTNGQRPRHNTYFIEQSYSREANWFSASQEIPRISLPHSQVPSRPYPHIPIPENPS